MNIITIYQHEVQIRKSDIDRMGHVNNVSYVGWMQEAAMAHSAANGWDLEDYQQLGMGWVAREHRIEYLTPAFLGDGLHLETWVSGLKRVSSTRDYRFIKKESGEVIAAARTQWAFINLQNQKPTKIPETVRNAFSVVQLASSD
ncbi:MAG: acyl-CoA thioesterase [Planctomycetota bacterium]|nr:acyl-CoA thioesterase [Planctomycetota bacterium]